METLQNGSTEGGQMRLTHVSGKFVLEDSSYEQRHIPKQAGFRWNPGVKRWWTDDPAKAYRLYEYANHEVQALLDGTAEVKAITASHALDADTEIPVPEGLSYYGFQKAGIAYAMARPCTLIGDEMGVGKTIQAVGVMNAMANFKNALVIVPASLKLNWKREIEKWLVHDRTIGVAHSTNVPDTDITIINYDIVKRNFAKLAKRYSVIVCDESHYVKNSKAQRTKAVTGLIRDTGGRLMAERTLFLTGTPVLNRPVELWTTLSTFDPASYKSFFGYAKRYCNATHNGWGWDFNGASRLDELQNRLRSSVMIRRLKREVLTELPPKVRQVIEIPQTTATRAAIKAETQGYEKWEAARAELAELKTVADSADNPEEYEAQIKALQDTVQAGFTELSSLRRITAEAKAPLVVDYIKDALDSSSKIVVFAHHVDVINQIADAFGEEAVRLYGAINQTDRQAAVDRFQTDDTCRVFVGGIMAAGVGLTLTAASHVVFAELDWVPGNLSQAEDRCHRIGQDSETVLIQHLVLENSLDAKLSHKIIDKQKVIDAALDNDTKVTPEPEPKPQPKPQPKPATEQAPEVVAAIHKGLQILADHCDGARAEDGQGFNKLDTGFGKSLAAAPWLSPRQAAAGKRLVRKYRKQLPDALLEVALS